MIFCKNIKNKNFNISTFEFHLKKSLLCFRKVSWRKWCLRSVWALIPVFFFFLKRMGKCFSFQTSFPFWISHFKMETNVFLPNEGCSWIPQVSRDFTKFPGSHGCHWICRMSLDLADDTGSHGCPWISRMLTSYAFKVSGVSLDCNGWARFILSRLVRPIYCSSSVQQSVLVSYSPSSFPHNFHPFYYGKNISSSLLENRTVASIHLRQILEFLTFP